MIAKSNLPEPTKALRTHSLRDWGQLRQAALFCVGMTHRIGHKVFLARSEASDYDFVASWSDGDTQHLASVQLKEVVPAENNPKASVQDVIDALPRKYVDSKDLTVAIYLNQQVHFDPVEVRAPDVQLSGLWVFGGLAPDGYEWGLWGDFLTAPMGTRFAYPA